MINVEALRNIPHRDGVAVSRCVLAAGPWRTVLEALIARFPQIAPEVWEARMSRGLVLDAGGRPLRPDARHFGPAGIHYWREVESESCLAGEVHIIHVDAHLLVADKPHGLPVTPAGDAVRDTLLAKLVRETGLTELAPMHRIDRDTAGLVMFAVQQSVRARFHAMFRERNITKCYEALADPLESLDFPHVRRSRIQRGEPFFRMHEVGGVANAETRIDVIERGAGTWRYELQPVTGRKHQLRVHMAAMGVPIFGETLYPDIRGRSDQPLALLARSLEFIDPISDASRKFLSPRRLDPAPV